MSWKRAFFRYGTAVPLMLAAASCAVVPPPAPAPTPAPTAAPAPPPSLPPVAAANWDEWPIAKGEWKLATMQGASGARFEGGPVVMAIHCDTRARTATLTVDGAVAAPTMTILTSAGSDAVAANGAGASGTHWSGSVPANSPILDRIAFSRGRFAIMSGNNRGVAIPVQSEIGRVIEDCRG